MPTKSNDQITLAFIKEKETKNTIRFQEVTENDLMRPKIGTVYVTKETFTERGSVPASLTLTLTFDRG